MKLIRIWDAVAGKPKITRSIASTTGVSDADKLIATDGSGLLDPSFLPDFAQSNIYELEAGEAITQGNLICIDASGNALQADNTDSTKNAVGFALNTAALGEPVTVQFSGLNPYKSGITSIPNLLLGVPYFLGLNGQITSTAPAYTSGYLLQEVGFALDNQTFYFSPQEAVEYE